METANRHGRKHIDERRQAVRGAFAIAEGARVDNFQILLLDDDMPSGATQAHVSRALRVAAKSVVGRPVALAGRQAISLRKSA